MLLNNEDYLRVIAEALRKDVLPELMTDEARAVLTTSVESLHDLIKRERNLPAIIADLAPGGQDLLNRINEFLGNLPIENTSPSHPEDFRALIKLIDDGLKALLDDSASPSDEAVASLLRDVGEWEERYYSAFRASEAPLRALEDERPNLLTADSLVAALQSRIAEPISVKAIQTIPGGFAHQTLFFTLERSGHADQKLVVRKKSAHPILDFWAGRLDDEYQIVSILHDQGLPVAQPLWLFKDRPDVAGTFYVMTRGHGRPAGALRDAYSGQERFSEELMLSLADFLGRLHGTPLEVFKDYIATGDTRVRIGDTVAEATSKNVADLSSQWRRRERLPVPSEIYVLDWLRRNIPEDDGQPVLVHGDCFVHNLVVNDQERVELVADWETAHIGSPAADLAYIKELVQKHIHWQKFAARYRESGGPAIQEAHFPYYNALLYYRNSWGTNIAAARIKKAYQDIRMLPLSSEYFATFLHNSIQSTSAASAHTV